MEPLGCVQITEISPFLMQNSSNLRLKVGRARYLTTLNLLKGHWEILLETNSKELISFVSLKGQYKWKVIAFGLPGTRATFHRTMNQALLWHSDYAESLIDDILIFSSDWEDNLKCLKIVLKTS